MNIGEKIREKRDKKRYTQDYVADQLGMSQQQYSKIESDDSDLRAKLLPKLCATLETSPNELLNFGEKNALASNNHNNKDFYISINQHQDKMIELLEKLNQRLEAENAQLKAENSALKSTAQS